MLWLLLMAPCVTAFAPRSSMARFHRQQLHAQPPLVTPDTIDAVMDFNSNFEKGLKYVLLPQSSKNGQIELSTYDSTKQIMDVVPSVTSDSSLDALASSSSNIAAGTFELDPVVYKTLAELERKMSDPPPLQDFHFPLPQGKGLAQPLVESLGRSLEQLKQQAPPLAQFPNYDDDSFVKTRYGFEVRTSVLDQLDSASALATAYRARIQTEYTDAVLPQVASNNAAIRDQLTSNWERVQHLGTNSAAVRDQLTANLEHVQQALRNGDQFTALTVQLKQLLQTPGWKLSDVVEVLKLDELGGWYAGALVGVLLLAVFNNNNTGKEKTSSAGLNFSTAVSSKKDAAEKERLEGMVTELTKAVNALSVELRELKSEKLATDSALQAMKTDVQLVQNAVSESGSTSAALRAQLQDVAAENAALKSQLDAAKFEVATLLEVNEALAEGINALGDTPQSANAIPHPPSTPPPVKIKVERKKSELFPEQNLYFFASESA